eukprot:8086178-Alexandrium_andersonii.AAC.1
MCIRDRGCRTLGACCKPWPLGSRPAAARRRPRRAVGGHLAGSPHCTALRSRAHHRDEFRVRCPLDRRNVLVVANLRVDR